MSGRGPGQHAVASPSGVDVCAGVQTLPDGPVPHPALVMGHGFGTTVDCPLEAFTTAFAAGDPDLAVVVAQVPFTDGPATLRGEGVRVDPASLAPGEHVGVPGVSTPQGGGTRDGRDGALRWAMHSGSAVAAADGTLRVFPFAHLDAYVPPGRDALVAAELAWLRPRLGLVRRPRRGPRGPGRTARACGGWSVRRCLRTSEGPASGPWWCDIDMRRRDATHRPGGTDPAARQQRDR